MSVKRTPIAIGLLACEQVIVEEKTRNVTPVNCFTYRTVRDFPAEVHPFVVFAALTDGTGEVLVKVIVVRLDTFDEVFTLSASVKFTAPHQEIRCIIRMRACYFPVPGEYQISLVTEDGILAQRKIMIKKKEEQT